MADFDSGFWSAYVAIVTILSILFCVVILVANSRRPAQTGDNTTGHVWDGDLREANNPLPRWWVGLFLITIVFSAGYLVWYPGLGAFGGTGGWSSLDQYQAERARIEEGLTPIYAGYTARTPEALVGDPGAMAIGERLYLNNCAQCHGSDARGSKGFPNLTDTDWLHGGTADAIRETITRGRHGVMPALGAAIGGSAEIERLAQYVLSLSGAETDKVKAELGRSSFATCAACHGPRGEGVTALGAPNLTDKVWLHGGGVAGVVSAIVNGRDNQMPAHADKLTPGQIHVLTAYVLSLSR